MVLLREGGSDSLYGVIDESKILLAPEESAWMVSPVSAK